MKVANHTVVKIHYTLKDNDGEVIDSSSGQDPLEYIHGIGVLLGKLENDILGRGAGDKISSRISAKDGYGERIDDLVQTVPADDLAHINDLHIGMTLQTEAPSGEIMNLTITSMDPESITLDANHPLAGTDLNFDVEIISVRPATAEELEHGHVHNGEHDH